MWPNSFKHKLLFHQSHLLSLKKQNNLIKEEKERLKLVGAGMNGEQLASKPITFYSVIKNKINFVFMEEAAAVAPFHSATNQPKKFNQSNKIKLFNFLCLISFLWWAPFRNLSLSLLASFVGGAPAAGSGHNQQRNRARRDCSIHKLRPHCPFISINHQFHFSFSKRNEKIWWKREAAWFACSIQ